MVQGYVLNLIHNKLSVHRPGFHTIVESCGSSMIGLLPKDEPEVIPANSAVNLKLSR